MKKIIPIILTLLVFGLVIGCGGDDDGGDGNGTSTPRVVANTSVSQPPPMNDANAAVWGQVDSVSIDVSGSNVPKISPVTSASIPAKIQVQAIQLGDYLYLRLKWADATFDTWPNYYSVSKTNEPPPDNRKIEFKHEQLPPAEEDKAFVLFENTTDSSFDVWNWRVLTTGAGGLAEGGKFSPKTNDTLVVYDQSGTFVGDVAMENPGDAVISTFPKYVHKDTSQFTGYVFYVNDTVNINDTLYYKIDTTIVGDPPDTIIDTTAVTPLHTQGWILGQRIPNYLIDSSLVNRTDAERGSCWDIKTAYNYNNVEYTVVMGRKLNTGYTDDLNMSTMDSVKVKIGLYDNQNSFSTASSHRGFSKEFWLILP